MCSCCACSNQFTSPFFYFFGSPRSAPCYYSWHAKVAMEVFHFFLLQLAQSLYPLDAPLCFKINQGNIYKANLRNVDMFCI